MKADDTWVQEGTGRELVVLGAYWREGRRDEDVARMRGRGFAGTAVSTQEDDAGMPEGRLYYISVPVEEHAAGTSALYGVL